MKAMNGKLAKMCGEDLPVQVLKLAAGFYLGTKQLDEEIGMPVPFTRESIEYFDTQQEAEEALASGKWTQKRAL